jgi:hypothetical protein
MPRKIEQQKTHVDPCENRHGEAPIRISKRRRQNLPLVELVFKNETGLTVLALQSQ